MLAVVILAMAVFFIVGTPRLMDDGVHYQGFTENLAHGHLDFKTYYGFQGLSFFAVPVYWITHSPIAYIITSMLLFLASIPLAFAVGKAWHGSSRAGWLAVMIVLLMPYPYVTLMRGFQEAGLLFFVLLILYGSLAKKLWTGLAWGVGSVVKPFALTLFPLFIRKNMKRVEIWFLVLGICIGIAYGAVNYVQTGHVVTLAAGGSYDGYFDTSNIPPLQKSFTLSATSFARAGANMLVHTRKILISPLLILLGLCMLRKKYLVAVVLNVLLVALLTFTFPKYLLPAVVVLAFSAIPLLLRRNWLIPLVLLDSLAVAIPIYNYFGKLFWSTATLALLPLYLAAAIGLGIAYRAER